MKRRLFLVSLLALPFTGTLAPAKKHRGVATRVSPNCAIGSATANELAELIEAHKRIMENTAALNRISQLLTDPTGFKRLL